MRSQGASAVRVRVGRVLVAAGIAWMAGAGTAHALTMNMDPMVPRTVTVSISVAVSDPGGTVRLLCDGALVATAPGVPGMNAMLGPVALPAGTRRLTADVSDGVTTVAAPPVTTEVFDSPEAPVLLRPTGGYAARTADVRVKAGGSTSALTVSVNGSRIARIDCVPGATAEFPQVALGPGVSVFSVTAENPFGQSNTVDWRVRRLDYPWPTCIIVDKSEYRLYWIKNGVLVKTYRIAHGKSRTPTPSAIWIVGAKEKRTPGGVYGPRRLRIYRRVGIDRRTGRYRYQIRQFGIHGTNQPWVIGTQASHGCIRLVNKDILELWPQVPVGTPVLTRQ
jgi:lipoprotein-anchoring transpeptidase ErfK/SrfK